MTDNLESKAAVSIAEMARIVGLTRQRFNQLIGTAFPCPIYSLATRRPFYDEELQRVCLDVRRRNFGIDGNAILFYAKGQRERPTKPTRSTKSQPKTITKEEHPEILAAVRSLGLASVTSDHVAAAVRAAFPIGVDGVDQGRVIRAVFLHLKRQDSGDKVGR